MRLIMSEPDSKNSSARGCRVWPAMLSAPNQRLGTPAGLQHGSAEMNMWLHRSVLRKIADNGGNVPKELLD